jgi:hypothetical protein
MENQENIETVKEIRSVEEITNEIKALEIEAEQMALTVQRNEYSVHVQDEKNLKSMIIYLEQNVPWSHQDAANLLALSSNLRSQQGNVDAEGNIKLRSVNLNTLYNSFLKINGKGLKMAKEHITYLAISGQSISESMQKLADDNQELRDMHTKLSDLDNELQSAQANQ